MIKVMSQWTILFTVQAEFRSRKYANTPTQGRTYAFKLNLWKSLQEGAAGRPDACMGQMASLSLGAFPEAWGVAGTWGWSTLRIREACLPRRVRRMKDVLAPPAGLISDLLKRVRISEWTGEPFLKMNPDSPSTWKADWLRVNIHGASPVAPR